MTVSLERDYSLAKVADNFPKLSRRWNRWSDVSEHDRSELEIFVTLTSRCN